MTTEDRRASHERIRRIDAAFRSGDLAALRAAVEDPAAVPNGPMPLAIGPCLAYAVYHSPISFVQTLIDIGAELSPDEHDGFPPVIAALSSLRSRPGSPARADALDVLALLLAAGADPNQRGLNDWTPLHMAVAERSLEAVRLLLEAGADPRLRTRIDDLSTPSDDAEASGQVEIVELLRLAEARASTG